MENVKIGKIIDSFSLDGSVKVISTTTNQDIRYKKGNVLFVMKDNLKIDLPISSHRRSGNFDILHFENINSVEEAQSLKGLELLAVKNQKDLKEGYYFFSDLVGCSIIADEKELGKVIEVEEFPAQITLRAKTSNGKTFFVPFIDQFIIKVDIESKKIYINYMEGML